MTDQRPPEAMQQTSVSKSMAEKVAAMRTMLGYSLEGAADKLGVSTSILRDAEAGEIEINAHLQKIFEDFYGVTFEAEPERASGQRPRTPLAYGRAQGILRVGTLGVRFKQGIDDNDVLLRGFSSAVRRQRQTPPSVPLKLRQADLPVLASLLDLVDLELDERAQFWFGQTTQTAQSFRTMLKLSVPPESEETAA